MSVRIQTALVADADAATVPGTAVCPHFQQFAVLGDGAVATDIEVVTYSPETTGLMVTKLLLGSIVFVTTCGATVEDEVSH